MRGEIKTATNSLEYFVVENIETVTDNLGKEEMSVLQSFKIDQKDILFSSSFYSNHQLQGLSVYINAGTIVKHYLFVRQRNQFRKVDAYTFITQPQIISGFNRLLIEKIETEVTGFSINKISYYYNQEFDIAQLQKLKQSNQYTSDDLYLYFTLEAFAGLNWTENSKTANCLSSVNGCYNLDNYNCVVENPTNPRPNGSCVFDAAGECEIYRQSSKEPFLGIVDLDKLTSFRDNFLLATPFGLKYVNYYYALSDHLSDKEIPLDLLIQASIALITINEKIDFLTSSEEGVLLNSYKEISNNINYHQILDTIIEDISNMEDLPKSQFFNEIQYQ